MVESDYALDDAFKQHVADCHILEKELELAISDLEFIAAGNHLYFAVDFSEIHSYANLDTPHSSFLLFRTVISPTDSKSVREEKRQDSRLRQFYTMERLFNISGMNLVLLAPYAAELRSFIQRHKEILSHKALEWLAAYGELNQRKIKYGELNQSSNLRERDTASQNLMNELRKRFIAAKQASEGEARVGERLKDLLEQKKFINIQSLNAEIDVETNIENHDEWFSALYNRRKMVRDQNTKNSDPEIDESIHSDPNSIPNNLGNRVRYEPLFRAIEFDTQAMELINHANQIGQYSVPTFRLILITRSDSMHSVFEGFASKWGKYLLIRHPRIFNLYGVGLVTENPTISREMIKNLDSRLKTLRRFRTMHEEFVADMERRKQNKDETPSIELSEDDARIIQGRRYDLELLLADISKGWRDIEVIPTDNQDLKSIFPSESEINHDEEFERIINDEHSFIKFIVTLHNLQTDWIDRRQDIVLASASPLTQTDQGILAELALRNNLLFTQNYRQPYPLYITSREVQHHLEMIADLEEGQLSYVLKNVVPNISNRSERWLFISYVHGLQNQWELAYRFSVLANDELDKSSDLEIRVETALLLAVCSRKRQIVDNQNPFFAYQESISTLQKTERLLTRNKLVDPRILKEKATQVIFAYTLGYEQKGFQPSLPRDFPSLERAFQWLDEAESQCQDDEHKYLKLQIQNNRLHFRLLEAINVKHCDIIAFDQVEYEYKVFNGFYEQDSNLEIEWNCTFIDTLLWARWNLYGGDQQQFGGIYEELTERSKRELAPEERKGIFLHKKLISERQRPLLDNCE